MPRFFFSSPRTEPAMPARAAQASSSFSPPPANPYSQYRFLQSFSDLHADADEWPPVSDTPAACSFMSGYATSGGGNNDEGESSLLRDAAGSEGSGDELEEDRADGDGLELRRSKNGTGYSGVYAPPVLAHKPKPFMAFEKGHIYVGCFSTAEDAARALALGKRARPRRGGHRSVNVERKSLKSVKRHVEPLAPEKRTRARSRAVRRTGRRSEKPDFFA